MGVKIFSRPALGPTQPPIQWIPDYSPGEARKRYRTWGRMFLKTKDMETTSVIAL